MCCVVKNRIYVICIFEEFNLCFIMWLCKRKKMESIKFWFMVNKGIKRVKCGRGVCDDFVVG